MVHKRETTPGNVTRRQVWQIWGTRRMLAFRAVYKWFDLAVALMIKWGSLSIVQLLKVDRRFLHEVDWLGDPNLRSRSLKIFIILTCFQWLILTILDTIAFSVNSNMPFRRSFRHVIGIMIDYHRIELELIYKFYIFFKNTDLLFLQ